MTQPRNAPRRLMSTAAVMASLVLLLSLLARSKAGVCQGTQDYKLKVTMQWNKLSDRDFGGNMRAGYIIVVSHTTDYKLFDIGNHLEPAVLNLIENNKFGALQSEFERLKKAAKPKVFDYNYVSAAGPEDFAYLNVKVDGSRRTTWVSLLGVMRNTPDYFFSFSSIPMCKQDSGNFTDRFPVIGLRDVTSYDGGFDERRLMSQKPKPTQRGVRIDSRPTLVKERAIATFVIEKGVYKRVFPFWKILVIVGVLATVILVAFICLYPYCCKKQMLDVPVPLQDESQWAT